MHTDNVCIINDPEEPAPTTAEYTRNAPPFVILVYFFELLAGLITLYIGKKKHWPTAVPGAAVGLSSVALFGLAMKYPLPPFPVFCLVLWKWAGMGLLIAGLVWMSYSCDTQTGCDGLDSAYNGIGLFLFLPGVVVLAADGYAWFRYAVNLRHSTDSQRATAQSPFACDDIASSGSAHRRYIISQMHSQQLILHSLVVLFFDLFTLFSVGSLLHKHTYG